ncbi:hypothetical protein [Bacillus sp. Marseille-P3661]|uniref:hypothetical protein n=1 Tax=Bacillus sp. Marseille-P3661 TaxID=1936234 RepID=UPI0015E173C7|nr:hypothetical protein [Bacillus sp. Marseille-P3661]
MMEPYNASKSLICKLCGRTYLHNKQGLFTSHLKKEHDLSLHDYLVRYYYEQSDLVCKGFGCNNIVKLRRGKPNQYCSSKCAQKKDKAKICPVCNEKFSNEDTRIKTCSLSCSKQLKASKIKSWHQKMSTQQKENHFGNIIRKTSRTRKKNKTPSWNSGKTGIYSEETIQKIRLATLKQMENQSFRKTRIERLMEIILKELGVTYTYSFILENRQYDFLVQSQKLIIECDGDYWHANPKFYPSPKDWQLERIQIDKQKNEIAIKNNYKIVRFWEFDILNNRDFVISKLKSIIYGL